MSGDDGTGDKPRATARDLLGADMPEGNPLLCDPFEKDALETKNGLDQLDFLEHLVVDLGVTDIRESHVLEMQKLAIRGIYPCAGEYRKTLHEVYIQRSRHRLPEPALVRGLVLEALDRVNEQRDSVSAIERAAYLLWRINWIHPFPGGNGRTSRALAHLVLCIEHGAMLPGSPSVPTLIKNESELYFKALQQADAADESGGENISLATELVLRTASQQLQSVVAAFAKPRK